LSSMLTRSSGLLVRSRRRWAAGKAKAVRPCGRFPPSKRPAWGPWWPVPPPPFSGGLRHWRDPGNRRRCGWSWATSARWSRRGTISLGILLEMKLAALPGHGGEHRRAGGAQPGLVIADQQLHPVAGRVFAVCPRRCANAPRPRSRPTLRPGWSVCRRGRRPRAMSTAQSSTAVAALRTFS